MIKHLNRGKFVRVDMQCTAQLLVSYMCLFLGGYMVKQARCRCYTQPQINQQAYNVPLLSDVLTNLAAQIKCLHKTKIYNQNNIHELHHGVDSETDVGLPKLSVVLLQNERYIAD